ncbi:MAG: UvrD-helicase domain-containing protein [Chloroflexota bacterium]
MATSELLDGLNEAQLQAVSAPPGPTMVIAGPGSGKTAVLTRRVAYLIQEMNVAPWRIMTVTFTNKAAKEMLERIERLLGTANIRGLTTGTFHAICAKILRREASYVGLRSDYVIYDTDDQVAVMKRVIEAANLDIKQNPPRGHLSKISNAKNELIGPMDYPATSYKEQITGELYQYYQEQLHLSNAVDFDDLLMMCVLLFQKNPDVLERYQGYYEHILVDEFQDTNTAQYALVRLLAGKSADLFCVGDPDQSIYKFRGADYRNIMRYQQDYPNAKTILLEQNYRSHQLILDAAMSIIDKNPDRVRKQLTTTRQDGAKIMLRDLANEEQEAEYIVEKIVELSYQGQYQLRDCAVMYRTNAQSRSLEEAFLRDHIPYKLVGATRFYGRREIKDLLAYLKLIHNPDDEVSLERIINVPPRGIGAKTLGELKLWATKRQQSMFRALQMMREGVDSPLSGRAVKSLTEFAALIDSWQQVAINTPLGPLVDDIFARSGLATYLNDGTPEGQERVENVREFTALAYNNGDVPLGEFLADVALVADADTRTDEANAVVLLTLHAAKGLEFPVVFIAGLEEGILPHQRALDDPEQMDEERRLMYVGLTRAKDMLFLTWAFRRSVWGNAERAMPSRFLTEIPGRLTTGSPISKNSTSHAEREGYRRTVTWSDPLSTSTNRTRTVERPNRFRTGQRVSHAKFGEGIVIASKVRGDDEEVDVKFESERVIKRLSANIANLVTLND